MRYPPPNLTAAAPDLYEAAKLLLGLYEELCAEIGISKHYPSAEKMRAAIAKADAPPEEGSGT